MRTERNMRELSLAVFWDLLVFYCCLSFMIVIVAFQDFDGKVGVGVFEKKYFNARVLLLFWSPLFFCLFAFCLTIIFIIIFIIYFFFCVCVSVYAHVDSNVGM